MLDGSNTAPLRYFLSPADGLIRIELPDGDSTYGELGPNSLGYEGPEYSVLKWAYARPDDDTTETAVRVLYGEEPVGWEFCGFESKGEMERQCSARCEACKAVMQSHNDLSLHGLCSRCFVAAMGAAS